MFLKEISNDQYAKVYSPIIRHNHLAVIHSTVPSYTQVLGSSAACLVLCMSSSDHMELHHLVQYQLTTTLNTMIGLIVHYKLSACLGSWMRRNVLSTFTMRRNVYFYFTNVLFLHTCFLWDFSQCKYIDGQVFIVKSLNFKQYELWPLASVYIV